MTVVKNLRRRKRIKIERMKILKKKMKMMIIAFLILMEDFIILRRIVMRIVQVMDYV
jgi:hypothetical protein